MNEIVLRAPWISRIAFVAIVAGLTALFAFSIPCETTIKRLHCELIHTFGPYLWPLLPFISVFYGWRTLLGRPLVTLSREGIHFKHQAAGMVRWSEIDDVKEERTGGLRHLVIARKPSPGQRGPEPTIHAIWIDCWLDDVRHWIEEGRRNAAMDVPPAPFFTPMR
jgi:hypothetical protein